MRPEDRMWYVMPETVTHAVLTLERWFSEGEIDGLAARLMQVERLTQAVETHGLAAPRWTNVENFCARNHLKVWEDVGFASTDEKALQRWITDFKKTALSRKRPLWDINLLNCDDGRCVMLIRVHHAVADGHGLGELFRTCVDRDDDSAATESTDPSATREVHQRGLRDCFISTAAALATLATRRPEARSAVNTGRVVEAALLGSRVLVWSAQKMREQAKVIGRGGGTVNDFLLTTVAETIKDLLGDVGDTIPTVRALQPKGLSPQRPPGDIGNSISTISCNLHVGEPDLRRRFEAIHEEMEHVKTRSMEAHVMKWFANCATRISAWAAGLICWLYFRTTRQHSVFVSNVTAPVDDKVSLCQNKVDSISWFGTPLGSVGLYVPTVTYGGNMFVRIMVDERLHLQPDLIADRMQHHFERLSRMQRPDGP